MEKGKFFMSDGPNWKISTTGIDIFPPFAHTLSKALQPFSRKFLNQIYFFLHRFSLELIRIHSPPHPCRATTANQGLVHNGSSDEIHSVRLIIVVFVY